MIIPQFFRHTIAYKPWDAKPQKVFDLAQRVALNHKHVGDGSKVLQHVYVVSLEPNLEIGDAEK